ncbi:hypothetical protein JXB41_06290 [Candidatus Woesearchaeota archaeon]|nr:hypothetical protein [Candidatus Woesearchaeota archaeon]
MRPNTGKRLLLTGLVAVAFGLGGCYPPSKKEEPTPIPPIVAVSPSPPESTYVSPEPVVPTIQPTQTLEEMLGEFKITGVYLIGAGGGDGSAATKIIGDVYVHESDSQQLRIGLEEIAGSDGLCYDNELNVKAEVYSQTDPDIMPVATYDRIIIAKPGKPCEYTMDIDFGKRLPVDLYRLEIKVGKTVISTLPFSIYGDPTSLPPRTPTPEATPAPEIVWNQIGCDDLGGWFQAHLDANGNGVYDEGDPLVYFIDVNGNGIYDPGVDTIAYSYQEGALPLKMWKPEGSCGGGGPDPTKKPGEIPPQPTPHPNT